METQFIPYELAVKLKELGFNEKCFSVYDTMGFHQDEREMNLLLLDFIKAPLWQQAFYFLRERGYDGEIYPTACGYRWTISKSAINPKANISGGTHVCDSGDDGPNRGGAWDTYEDASYACLEKLIELCK